MPAGLLSRQQAWSLAHASDHVASTDGEMLDPWDVDEGQAAPPDIQSTRLLRDAIERALGVLLADARCDCSLDELSRMLRAAHCRYPRTQVDATLREMAREQGSAVAYEEGRVRLL